MAMKLSDIEAVDFSKLTRKEKLDLLSSLTELSERVTFNKLAQMYPQEGPFSRDKYSKQMDFFSKGLKFRQRALMGELPGVKKASW